MDHDPLAPALAALVPDQPPRVWSFLVTLFGDLAQGEGDVLSGALLGHLTSRIGIRSEALRVALHRLRNDGWIESHKRGRSRDYGLTAHGRAESLAAAPRIYGCEPAPEGDWHLVWVGGETSAATLARLGRLDRTIELGASALLVDHCPSDPALLSGKITGDLPGWVRDVTLPPGMVAHTDDLLRRLDSVARHLASPLEAKDTAVLRGLIVHEWRRIALRLPPLPDRFFPASWNGPACRAQVSQLLADLPRPDLHTLSRDDFVAA